jgi:hypothetical protein
MPTSLAAWGSDTVGVALLQLLELLRQRRDHRAQFVNGLAHAHGTVLVVVQALAQILDALVTQRIALGLLCRQLALALAVIEEEPQAQRPQQRQEDDSSLKINSDALQLGPLFLGHHLVQFDQDQQFAVLVAHALNELGRLFVTDVRRGLDFRLTQVNHFGHAVDQDADHLLVGFDDDDTGVVADFGGIRPKR